MKTTLLTKTCFLAIVALALLPVGNALAVDYSFEFHAPDQGAVGPLGEQIAFHTTITNTGDLADTYVVIMEEVLPDSWSTSLCVGELCYSPFQYQIEVPALAGEVMYLDIDINPVTDVGQADVIITVVSMGNQTLGDIKEFTAVSAGLDILLVDADSDETSLDYYQTALAGSGKTYANWNRSLHGALATSECEGFDTVIWAAGNTSPGLVDEDRTNLVNFLQLGGKAIFSGQNLAYDVADPGSPNYSPGGTTYLQTILGVGYASNNTGGTGLDGTIGDIVSQGKTFVLGGGNGHNMNTSPDGLTALGNGSVSLTYSPGGETAAVKSTYGLGRTYFMGFGLENISTTEGRADLMVSILAWLDGATPAFDMVSPLLAGSVYSAPNPFNPQTSIIFEVGGVVPSNAEIVIFDVRGHIVRNLFSGELAPGFQNMVWNGRNDQGQTLSTGLYLAQVKVGHESEVVKMTLAK